MEYLGIFDYAIDMFLFLTVWLLITLLDKGATRGKNSESHVGRDTQDFKSTCKCRRN